MRIKLLNTALCLLFTAAGFQKPETGHQRSQKRRTDLSAHYKEIVQTRTERAVLPDAESVPFLTVDAAAATGR